MVADAAMASGAWQQVRGSDRDRAKCSGELLPGVAMLLPDALGAFDAIHVAIGDARARQQEAQSLGPQRLASVVHARACVSPQAAVARGCFVAALAVVAPGARLDEGAIVNHGAVVDHDAAVGAYSHIAPNATLGGFARVGRRVLVGAGATLLPEVVVGDDIVVGAGAVVCHDLSAPGTYAGVPARRLA